MGSLSLLQGIFPTQELGTPELQADSLPAELPGKPKNTGVDSLFLLQQIFPTQGSIPGLLHCRQILYQLSHMGSPKILSGKPIPSPGDLPNPEMEPGSPALLADSLPTELLGTK